MKVFTIIAFVLLLLFGYLVFSKGKKKKEHEENLECLSKENFALIRDSPYADELSKYSIQREEDKLRFRSEGYTLFYLQLETDGSRDIKLVGLDGYGIRDKEFLKYTCDLVKKIVEKNKHSGYSSQSPLVNIDNDRSKNVIVEGKENLVTINGKEVTFPIHHNTLVEIFGEPSQKEYSETAWYVVWDELGVSCNYGSWDNILGIYFFQSERSKIKFPPNNLFEGKLLVDDNDFTITDFETIEFGKTSIRRTVYEKGGAPVGFYVGKNYNYKEEIPKDKYLIQPKSDIIQFKDFNFKLCIIEELMYNHEVIAPKFDLYEFAEWYQEREIDIEAEGYDLIPEVTQYFKDLPIEKKHALLVTEFYQDGGNDIYMNMMRFGSGDVAVFDIESAADAVYFPNLKKVTLCYAKKPVLDEFKRMGIEAGWL